MIERRKLIVDEIPFMSVIPELEYWDLEDVGIDVIPLDYHIFAFCPIRCEWSDEYEYYVRQRVHFIFDRTYKFYYSLDAIRSQSIDSEIYRLLPEETNTSIGSRLLTRYIYDVKNGMDPDEYIKNLKYIIITHHSYDYVKDTSDEIKRIYIVMGDFHKLFKKLYGPELERQKPDLIPWW